jgi:polyferredoxin
VIAPALYGAPLGQSPLIADAACTRCARCIDVCDAHVFRLDMLRPRRPGGQVECGSPPDG